MGVSRLSDLLFERAFKATIEAEEELREWKKRIDKEKGVIK